MPFAMTRECKCCRDFLWHCKSDWEEHHHSGPLGVEDYIPPKWFGQTMGDMGLIDKLLNIERSIKEDKNRKYKEYEYGH